MREVRWDGMSTQILATSGGRAPFPYNGGRKGEWSVPETQGHEGNAATGQRFYPRQREEYPHSLLPTKGRWHRNLRKSPPNLEEQKGNTHF